LCAFSTFHNIQSYMSCWKRNSSLGVIHKLKLYMHDCCVRFYELYMHDCCVRFYDMYLKLLKLTIQFGHETILNRWKYNTFTLIGNHCWHFQVRWLTQLVIHFVDNTAELW
jgi:hypothetical protein